MPCCLTAGWMQSSGWAMLHASYLLRKHAKGEEVPKDVPCFGAQVVVRQRQRDSNDFMPRGLSARYLGVCERIVGGSFVLYQSGSVGTTACARPVLSPGATQTPNPTHRLRQKVSWADLVEEEHRKQGTHLGTQPQPDLSSEPPWQAVPRRRRWRGKQKGPPTSETLPLSSAFLALVENVGERDGDEVSAPAVLLMSRPRPFLRVLVKKRRSGGKPGKQSCMASKILQAI